MRTINKNWLWVIGGLLLLNISLLTFIWIKKPNHEPAPFLEERLNFTAEQKEQFEELKAEHRNRMEAVKDELNELKDELYGGFSATNLPDKKAKEITDKMGRKKAEGDFLTYQHFKEVRSICTPEQQREFDSLIGNIVQTMNGPQPPSGGAPPRDGPGGRPEGMPPPPPR